MEVEHALGANLDLYNGQTNDKIIYSKIIVGKRMTHHETGNLILICEKDKDTFLLCLSIKNIQIGAQRVPTWMFIMGRHKRKVYALKLSYPKI